MFLNNIIVIMLGYDYLITSFLFSNVNKISTGYWFYDIFITFGIIIFLNFIMENNQKGRFVNIIIDYITGQSKYNCITFSSSDREVSNRYRALMHYISQSNHPTVKELFEIEMKKYNPRTDYDEFHSSIYRVSQNKKFMITDDIEGRVYWSSKDKSEYNGKVSYVEYQNLEISSKKLSTKEMIQWVENIEKNYKQFLKSKMLEGQALVEVSWDQKDDYVSAFCIPWSSNVTFENRFFKDKELILEKVNFFLNNETWYKERGIPYTLGILLWGEPGCGKTGFIKALMSLTKRHGIDIKLSKKFDMNRLKEIICNDEITEDIIIPQNQRILLFEDIDAMGDVVKDRDLPKESSEIDIEKKINEALNNVPARRSRRRKNDDDDNDLSPMLIQNSFSTDNNNLSYFLNILDGLNECPGRIIIMTTNKPEYLDKALIRPGRIDFKIHMTKATNEDILNIMNFYWRESKELVLDSSLSEILSHAEIVSCCRMSNSFDESFKTINHKVIMKQNEKSSSVLPTPTTDNSRTESDSVANSEESE